MTPPADHDRRAAKRRVEADRELRLRYLYHDLVLRGKLRISLETAKKLIGPDRAYHLYGLIGRRMRRFP